MREQERIMLGKGYVTAREAATLAGIEHVGTIHRWAKEKKLDYQRGGAGRNAPWYISVASLYSFFASAEHPAEEIVKRISDFMTKNGLPVPVLGAEPAKG